MKTAFITLNILLLVIAPIGFALLIKEVYNFITKELDDIEYWEQDNDPIGAWAISNCGVTYYFSLGEYEDDSDTDTYGFPDEQIAWYVDSLDEIVGTEFDYDEYIVAIVEVNQ